MTKIQSEMKRFDKICEGYATRKARKSADDGIICPRPRLNIISICNGIVKYFCLVLLIEFST